MTQQLFELNATRTINRVAQTFQQRGNEYADTWRHGQWLAMKATAERIGLNLDQDECRMLAAAALVDVKYARLMGGYKDDTVIDGIAYAANWAEEMRAFDEKHKGQHTELRGSAGATSADSGAVQATAQAPLTW